MKWTFEGPCAEQLARAFAQFFKESKGLHQEISAIACINDETGVVDKLIVDTIGEATSTQLKILRVCSTKHSQISLHTHQESGISKFSHSDALTITERLNEGVDDGSCVVGHEKTVCIVKAELDHQ